MQARNFCVQLSPNAKEIDESSSNNFILVNSRSRHLAKRSSARDQARSASNSDPRGTGMNRQARQSLSSPAAASKNPPKSTAAPDSASASSAPVSALAKASTPVTRGHGQARHKVSSQNDREKHSQPWAPQSSSNSSAVRQGTSFNPVNSNATNYNSSNDGIPAVARRGRGHLRNALSRKSMAHEQAQKTAGTPPPPVKQLGLEISMPMPHQLVPGQPSWKSMLSDLKITAKDNPGVILRLDSPSGKAAPSNATSVSQSADSQASPDKCAKAASDAGSLKKGSDVEFSSSCTTLPGGHESGADSKAASPNSQQSNSDAGSHKFIAGKAAENTVSRNSLSFFSETMNVASESFLEVSVPRFAPSPTDFTASSDSIIPEILAILPTSEAKAHERMLAQNFKTDVVQSVANQNDKASKVSSSESKKPLQSSDSHTSSQKCSSAQQKSSSIEKNTKKEILPAIDSECREHTDKRLEQKKESQRNDSPETSHQKENSLLKIDEGSQNILAGKPHDSVEKKNGIDVTINSSQSQASPKTKITSDGDKCELEDSEIASPIVFSKQDRSYKTFNKARNHTFYQNLTGQGQNYRSFQHGRTNYQKVLPPYSIPYMHSSADGKECWHPCCQTHSSDKIHQKYISNNRQSGTDTAPADKNFKYTLERDQKFSGSNQRTETYTTEGTDNGDAASQAMSTHVRDAQKGRSLSSFIRGRYNQNYQNQKNFYSYGPNYPSPSTYYVPQDVCASTIIVINASAPVFFPQSIQNPNLIDPQLRVTTVAGFPKHLHSALIARGFSHGPIIDYFGDTLEEKIANQVSYYFSDFNLSRDQYLLSQFDSEGWVPLSIITKFKRIMYLTEDAVKVSDALQKSSDIEVSKDKMKVRGHKNWQDWIIASRVANEANVLSAKAK